MGKLIKNERLPNLGTILMVENLLKENQDIPMKISEIKVKLPKQVMHQTLKVILNYLWESGKIIYGPKGIQWIYVTPERMEEMMNNSRRF